MVAKTGDRVRFRDVTGEHRLTGVTDDGIVQYEVGDKIYTTDVSEIVHNYNEAVRDRAVELEEGFYPVALWTKVEEFDAN